jgi:hypothetical protein
LSLGTIEHEAASALNALLLLFTVAAAQNASQRQALAEALSYDGLQQIQVRGIDMAYALPRGKVAVRGG